MLSDKPCLRFDAAMTHKIEPIQEAKYPFPVVRNGPRNVTKHAITTQIMANTPKNGN